MTIHRSVMHSFGLTLVIFSVGCFGEFTVQKPVWTAKAGTEKPLERGMEALTRQISAGLPHDQPLLTAVLDFHDLAGNVTAFGRLVSEELVTKLSQTRMVRVVERSLLEKAMDELQLNQSERFDPHQAKQLGKQVGAEAIVTGTVADLGAMVKINARLIDVEKGNILSAAGAEIMKDRGFGRLMNRVLSGPTKERKGASLKAVNTRAETAQAKQDGSHVYENAGKYQELQNLRIEIEGLRAGQNQVTVFYRTPTPISLKKSSILHWIIQEASKHF